MGELDLPRQFGRKARQMLIAVEEGRAAHKANNIKASGAPFEEQFRSLLADSLPSTSKVASGYFYGPNSTCSGEVDVLVYEDREAFRLDPAPQEQHYVPCTSASILGQVKNSANDLAGAIQQAQNSIKAWHEMQQEMGQAGVMLGGPTQERPMTFVVCGDCDNAQRSKLAGILQAKGRPYVDYILLLDRGEIVAGNLDFFEDDDPIIGFTQYQNVNSLHVCEPGGADDQVGVALLWFYFALVSKLNLDQGNNLRYHSFCRQISNLYPLRPTEKLI
ncbi:DUF6602 domain-containing protein [Lysobacter silvisoli]|nr:DUF6602 domain-containing protein [Lysobacter silvisoli]